MIPDQPQTIGDILHSAWCGKAYLFAGAGLGIVIGAVLMIIIVPQYSARMIIAPPAQAADERSLTFLNANASLPVTSVSSRVSRDYTKFQQTFREVSAARILMKYQGVMEAVNKSGPFIFSGNAGIETPDEFSDYIKDHVTMEPVGPTSSLILSYRHPDPEFAAKFLQHLHKITDEMIRNDARDQTEARMVYLQKALKEAYNPDNRKALADQLMIEEHQRMMISMGEPFSAELIEPPSSSSKPVWPKAGVIFPACILMGAFFGFLLFLMKLEKK